MVSNDPRDDRQAETGAAPLGGEIGQKELLAVARRHPTAGVGDLDRDLPVPVGQTNRDLAAVTAGLERVVEKVDQGPFDLLRIQQDALPGELRVDSYRHTISRAVEQTHG